MPDEVTGSTMNAHPSFIEPLDEEPTINASVEGEITFVEPANLEPDVYGIAYPKALLPLGAMHGTWEADYILDIDGNEQDVPYVRVWLYAILSPREETDE